MYTKIFVSMYDGSLRKDWKALVTMQQFLILSDSEGYVDMTTDAIISRTTVPEEIIVPGIETLESPDPESRSQEEEGRRIVLINPVRKWGWRIVNFKEYRDVRNAENLRSYWRGKKKESRERVHEPDEETVVTRWEPPTLDEVKLICAKSGMPVQEAEKFFNHHSARGWMLGRVKMKSVSHAVGTWKSNWQSGQFNGTNGQPPGKTLQQKLHEEDLRRIERL